MPKTLKVDLTYTFTLPLNVDPSVDASSNAERGKLDCSFTNLFVTADIVVQNLNNHIVGCILHIEFESLVPDGGLTSSLLHSCLETLLACGDFSVRVHLAKNIRVSSETGFFHYKG